MLNLFEEKQWFSIHDIIKSYHRNDQGKGYQINQGSVNRFQEIKCTDGRHKCDASHYYHEDKAIYGMYPAHRFDIGVHILFE
jgi:hypothetical protein